jgi:hypothetical protein
MFANEHVCEAHPRATVMHCPPIRGLELTFAHTFTPHMRCAHIRLDFADEQVSSRTAIHVQSPCAPGEDLC